MASALEMIESTIECLKPAVPAGTRMIVFGSRARGDATDDSDIDLLIIEPEVGNRSVEMVRLADLLGRRLIPADVVVLSREQYERQSGIPNTLAWRAGREGQEYELSR